MDSVTQPGRIRRINGPLVEVQDVPDTAMYEVLELGELRIPAEVVAISGGTCTLQAFEYTGGLRAGGSVRRTGRPLSARLGPGLLGQVFDGLLRPLSTAPTWLSPQQLVSDDSTAARWHFVPGVEPGHQARQ